MLPGGHPQPGADTGEIVHSVQLLCAKAARQHPDKAWYARRAARSNRSVDIFGLCAGLAQRCIDTCANRPYFGADQPLKLMARQLMAESYIVYIELNMGLWRS